MNNVIKEDILRRYTEFLSWQSDISHEEIMDRLLQVGNAVEYALELKDLLNEKKGEENVRRTQ